MNRQYWVKAGTVNCVWIFQEKGLFGRWEPKAVLLTNEEANAYGKNAGEKDKDWRVYGVPCYGMMADLLGQHVKEFEFKVDYISV